MSSKSLVSIIIPVYNSSIALFESCIKSINKQSYKEIEIIIIDDGSDEKYSNCYRAVINSNPIAKIYKTKNQGVSKARNYAISKSNGQYLLFIDADDIISVDYVEKLVEKSQESNKAIVFPKTQCVTLSNKTIDWHEFETKNLNINNPKEIFKKIWLYSCRGALFEKAKLKNKVFDEIKYGEDILFTIKNFKNNNIAYQEKAIYKYLDNPKGAMRALSEESLSAYMRDNIYYLNQLKIVYPKHRDAINGLIVSKINSANMRAIQGQMNLLAQFKTIAKIQSQYGKLKIDYSDMPLNQKLLSFLFKKKLLLFYYLLLRIKIIIRSIQHEKR